MTKKKGSVNGRVIKPLDNPDDSSKNVHLAYGQ